MPNHTQRQDRYGLPITTSSTLAAERFIEGIDLLLGQNFGPEEQFTQAIEAYAEFALAHSALAYMLNLRAQVVQAREQAQRAQAGTEERAASILAEAEAQPVSGDPPSADAQLQTARQIAGRAAEQCRQGRSRRRRDRGEESDAERARPAGAERLSPARRPGYAP